MPVVQGVSQYQWLLALKVVLALGYTSLSKAFSLNQEIKALTSSSACGMLIPIGAGTILFKLSVARSR